jgi:hypothetical protein
MVIPTYLRELHSSLDSRLRPEDVLAIIARGRPSALPEKWRVAFREATWGRKGYYSTWSSMSSDFARPVGAGRQIVSAERAFQHPLSDAYVDLPDRDIDPDDPAELAFVTESLAAEIGGNGQRLDREQRKAAGVELSRRKYNRQWRAMRRLHHKTNKLALEIQKHEMQLIGRSGFASKITLERFATDPAAAHFIAYWVARKNLRRQFSLEGKQNPMDEVATWFLSACVDSETTDWMLIALACPNPGILNKLSDREQGWLLAEWFSVMRTCASVLQQAWPADVDKLTMIVRRGHDSSTWNTMAQAYNTARASWLACIAALGAERMLDAACPGKVMRLMAADLAYWHRSTSGSDADPNSEVWANLPMPWEVLSGEVECTRSQVEGVCRIVGLDPRNSGWTAPRPAAKPVPFSVTPELVHGVTVASPEWAMLLRRAGVFSGKRLTDDYQLRAEVAHGLTSGVVVSDLPSRPLVE